MVKTLCRGQLNPLIKPTGSFPPKTLDARARRHMKWKLKQNSVLCYIPLQMAEGKAGNMLTH